MPGRGPRPGAGTRTGSREIQVFPSGCLHSSGPTRVQAGGVGTMLDIIEKILCGEGAAR